MMEIEESRERIDEIDKKILKLVIERFGLSSDIAKYKIKNNLEVLDINRESVIIEDRYKFLKTLGVDDMEFTNAFFGILLIKSKQVQLRVMETTSNVS